MVHLARAPRSNRQIEGRSMIGLFLCGAAPSGNVAVQDGEVRRPWRRDAMCTHDGHEDCHDPAMSVPHTIFFDLPLAANAVGLWPMTSALGILHDFQSRKEALEFALHEARKTAPWARAAIRVEGADLRWRSFDCGLKAWVDGKSLPADGPMSV